LILKALWGMYCKCPKYPMAYVIAAVAFVLAALVKVNIIVVILLCAVLGLVSSWMAERRKA
jgi:chromate transporter